MSERCHDVRFTTEGVQCVPCGALLAEKPRTPVLDSLDEGTRDVLRRAFWIGVLDDMRHHLDSPLDSP